MSGRRTSPVLREHGPVFWVGIAAGWAVMAFGIWTFLRRAGATRPANAWSLLVGLAIAHDLVLAPLVTGLAAWLVPRLPRRVRPAIVAAAIVSGILALVSLPPILGDQPGDNSSLLPRDYPAGLAIALASVWAVTFAAVGVLRVRSRKAP